MCEGCLNSACLWGTLNWRWRTSWTLGELFYNHPLGTVTSSSHISCDPSQRPQGASWQGHSPPGRASDTDGPPPMPTGEGGIRRRMGEDKLWGTEEQRQGLKLVLTPFSICLVHSCRWSVQKANTPVQGHQHTGWLWQCCELFEFPIMAHYIRRTCPHGSTWPIMPPKSFQIHLFLLISKPKN